MTNWDKFQSSVCLIPNTLHKAVFIRKDLKLPGLRRKKIMNDSNLSLSKFNVK